ncbi:hypothetical protein [uncultured Pseudoteredinibacter sp.]|uniref:hypothetical protein n=1 Tax=uncultured Pseudoteredinibacter sp. TaxID=1641701 RepID=UPI00262AE9FD|nr:hypothetical protein [uncultured Pseudoteredinibacter sp.]
MYYFWQRLRKVLVLKSTVITLFFSAYSLADGNPNTVSSDLFDLSQGTVVTNSDAFAAPESTFSPTGTFEGGHTLMRAAGFAGSSFIEFRTSSRVSIGGFRLFAGSDFGVGVRRAMSNFRLLADLDDNGSYETVVYDEAISPNYSSQAGNVATIAGQLDLTVLLPRNISSQNWRLETIQASSGSFSEVRLMELDAIEAFARPVPALPIPMLFMLLVSLLVFVNRRLKA